MTGLVGTVIGVDLDAIPPDYRQDISQFDGITMIPSLVMALLTSRLVLLWFLNVMFLICVPISVSRLSKKEGKVSA
jgi:hypothetical protein